MPKFWSKLKIDNNLYVQRAHIDRQRISCNGQVHLLDGCYRWALKQERFDNLGQWKHTEADNPEWHKQALSWPTHRDGRLNENYDWPMEGYLLPNAPPLRSSPSSDKNYGDGMPHYCYIATVVIVIMFVCLSLWLAA